MVAPADLHPHPKNWRLHSEGQRAALRTVLANIGVANACVAYRDETGKLILIDGHMRREEMIGLVEVPVLVLDVNEKEAEAILATHDSLTHMAGRDDAAFEALLKGLEGDAAMDQIIRQFSADADKAARFDDPEVEGEFATGRDPKYPIVQQFDEAYDAIIITSTSEAEWAQLQTVLPLPKKVDRHGKLGGAHVISAKDFMELWQKSKS